MSCHYFSLLQNNNNLREDFSINHCNDTQYVISVFVRRAILIYSHIIEQ